MYKIYIVHKTWSFFYQRVKDLCGQGISSLPRGKNEPDTNTHKNATCSALRKPFT
jgi:hypothetical protein